MKFDHIALVSKNIDKSLSWYSNHFDDFKINYKDDTWASCNLNGISLSFVSPHQHPQHIAFNITEKEAKTLFSEKIFKKHRDGTSSCYINDPDGNKIEFLIRPKDE